MDINDHSESEDANGEGDGVWSPDIEQCFREALLLYPPCGRRKHILQEEGGGKMYGRNELIARYIMLRTGKSRTRKQVSSHIQVLARRKAKAEAASSSSSGVSPSPSAISRIQTQSVGPMGIDPSNQLNNTTNEINDANRSAYYDVWVDRPIVSQKIRLVEFSAFIEYRTFPTLNIANVNTQNQLLHSVHSPCSNEVLMSPTLQTTTTIKPDPVEMPAIGQLHIQPAAGQTVPASTHPLASNHHLPAQFNQASYGQMNNQLQPHLSSNTHLTSPVHPVPHCNNLFNNHTQQQQSYGFKRHSYVQIDYRQTLGRQTNKLERIDISQIQDKFPEIGGSDGLFQRGPADAFFLVKFWADFNNDYEYNIDDQNSYFGFSSHFETIDSYKNITCSTKACSYGLQVVEKMERMYGAFNSSNGRYSYGINRSPMCDFMQKFIKKLRQLPRASQMNSVLENFTVLQVITSESTSEILLCLAYVFEVASPDQQNNGAQYHVYKLTKD